MAAQFEGSIKSIREMLGTVETGPRLYHDLAPGLWTSGSGSLVSEAYTILKAENIFSDILGSIQVSPEQIVARDPQVIISVHPDGPALIRADLAFRHLSAVKDNRLFFVDGSLLSITGPRLVHGVELVAKFLYPEIFP